MAPPGVTTSTDSPFFLLISARAIGEVIEPAFEQALAAIDAFVGPGAMHAFPALTRRERTIVEHLAQGLDNAQIAARLELSEKTVRNNITQIFAKMEVENRPQAIVRARDAGFGVRAQGS